MYAPLDTLIETIGLELTKKLVQAHGGERLYFPQAEHVTSDSGIARVIGVAPARALSALWAQEYVEIPNARRQMHTIVRVDIVRDSQHMTIRELVRKYKITRRGIHRILAEGPQPESRQRILF